MGLCVLYYVEYSLYNVKKKVGFFFLSGLELDFKSAETRRINQSPNDDSSIRGSFGPSK